MHWQKSLQMGKVVADDIQKKECYCSYSHYFFEMKPIPFFNYVTPIKLTFFFLRFLLEAVIDVSAAEFAVSLVSQPTLKWIFRFSQIFPKESRIIVMCFSEMSFTAIFLIFNAHSII